MTYNLGIDIGIASVGFAGVNADLKQILFCGAHIFEAAENPKTGASLAEPRREKRGMRRVIGRRSQRKKQIRALLARHGLQDLALIDQSRHSPTLLSPWDLRKEALERKLTDAEFARVLFHIAKRRGFQSNRKGAEANDTDGKKALSGAKDLQDAMMRASTQTIGAYLATLPKKRNGDGSYERFVTRDLLREEVKIIFTAQNKFGNNKAASTLLHDYAGNGKAQDRNTLEGDGIAFYQRPLQSSEHLVGECTFEPSEKRAPKFSYTAELFVLWTKINNARIRSVNGDERLLTSEEKNLLCELAHKNKGGVTYKQARKVLSLSSDERFNISYRKIKDSDNSWEAIRDTSEASYFLKLTGYHALKAALDTGSTADWQSWIGSRKNNLDDIARILSFHEDKKQVDEMLSKHALSEAQKENLCAIKGFSKSIDLSLKAVRKILPLMQTGMRYDEACKEKYEDHHGKKGNKGLNLIPPFEDIRNPVVNRALAQTRKVINACIRKYGMPETIIIEIAREVGKNFKDRKDIERAQKKNEAYRNEARQHIAEILGIIEDNVRGEDILRYRLWKEQDGLCPYSGVYMTPEILRDSVATQIDHIIPYRRSWNNSYMNKVLCFTDENQNKGNETPVEYFNRTGRKLASLETFARQLPPKKADNLLLENFDEEKAGMWKSRALNDTRYIAKLLISHLRDNLDLGKGNHIQTRNGSLTFQLRGAWGFPDKNRRNDRHHALDAIVIACSTQSMVQRLSSWDKYEARKKKPSERPLPPKPWDSFRDDALIAVNAIFVSRMPVHKITGAAHQDTIRSKRSDGKVIQRIKLKSLSLATLENMVDKARNFKLYNVLKERLDAHNGKADKAFAKPVYMPVNDPSKTAPRISSVRIVTNEKSGIEINEGLASNGDMVRVDVFQKDGKYYLVPIYVHHFVKNELPNKAIIGGKNEKDWLEMDDTDFVFSLSKNDLVQIQRKKGIELGYYVGTDRATGAISIRAHDNDPEFGKEGLMRSIGVKTLLSFEKYSVNYFGEKHKVGKEKRLGVAQCNGTKPSKAQPQTGTATSGK